MILQINDRYEFPLQLDLDRENGKYLSPEANRSIRNLYTLHRYLLLLCFFPWYFRCYSAVIFWLNESFLLLVIWLNKVVYCCSMLYILSLAIDIWLDVDKSLKPFVLTPLLVAFSVLVHSGGVHGGHYYAYIRPTLSDQWYVVCSGLRCSMYICLYSCFRFSRLNRSKLTLLICICFLLNLGCFIVSRYRHWGLYCCFSSLIYFFWPALFLTLTDLYF